jgi:hypothetical protein
LSEDGEKNSLKEVIKMPKACSVLLLVVALLVFAAPALADDLSEQSGGGQVVQQENGIRPVSPEEFADKTNNMINSLYAAAGPVADTVAKIMLALCGIAAFLVLLSGIKLLHRVIGAVLCVGFGLILFYGAPYIVGLVKGLAQYAMR